MIKISHLSKKFGNLEVLKDINLDIEEGEVVCIIGPSGSGECYDGTGSYQTYEQRRSA